MLLSLEALSFRFATKEKTLQTFRLIGRLMRSGLGAVLMVLCFCLASVAPAHAGGYVVSSERISGTRTYSYPGNSESSPSYDEEVQFSAGAGGTEGWNYCKKYIFDWVPNGTSDDPPSSTVFIIESFATMDTTSVVPFAAGSVSGSMSASAGSDSQSASFEHVVTLDAENNLVMTSSGSFLGSDCPVWALLTVSGLHTEFIVNYSVSGSVSSNPNISAGAMLGFQIGVPVVLYAATNDPLYQPLNGFSFAYANPPLSGGNTQWAGGATPAEGVGTAKTGTTVLVKSIVQVPDPDFSWKVELDYGPSKGMQTTVGTGVISSPTASTTSEIGFVPTSLGWWKAQLAFRMKPNVAGYNLKEMRREKPLRVYVVSN